MTPTLTELAQDCITAHIAVAGTVSGSDLHKLYAPIAEKSLSAFLTAAAQAEKEAKERAAELSALRAEVAEVLRPFAENIGYTHQPDSMNIVLGAHKDDIRLEIKLGNLRAAAALLAKLGGGE